MPSPRLNRLATLLLAVSLFLALPLQASGQGVPWHVVPLPIPGGFVDTMTGKIHIEIPLASFPQRNSDPLALTLMYDSDRFTFSGNVSSFIHTGPGWQLISGTGHSGTGFMGSSTTQACPSGYPNGSVSIQSQPSFTDSHGTTHVNINSNLYTKQVNCYTTSGTPYGNGSDITSFVGVADGSFTTVLVRAGFSGRVIRMATISSMLLLDSPTLWAVAQSPGPPSEAARSVHPLLQ